MGNKKHERERAGNDLTLESLAMAIQEVNSQFSERAARAVNINLTLRNLFMGMYISEYLLKGADRAEYGENVLTELSGRLAAMNVAGTGRRQLYNYLGLYRIYPEIVLTMTAQLEGWVPKIFVNGQKVRTPSAQSLAHITALVENLSYSHLELLAGIDDGCKRRFYETETFKGNWSVRELKRQISSLYYERSALSTNKEMLSEIANSCAARNMSSLDVRDPYIFEFLGLKPNDVMGENELENSLLDRLQEFLLELGRGFCFEARQKRIMIGGEYFFVDMVFYHRILKCHILIELKTDEFNHAHIGQLNTYVNWYIRNEKNEGDNPPIGILLCSNKNNALVEYALAGMDNALFVSKYKLELPKMEELQKFLEAHKKG